MKRFISACLCLAAVLVSGTAWAGVNFNELDSDARGSGTLRMGRQVEQVNRVYVHFKRSGDVEIVLYGDRTYRVDGRWFGGGDHSVEIDILRAFNDSRATGRGEAWFGARNKFERLELSGKAGGNNFSFSFREGNTSGGGGNRPGGGGSVPFEELNATSDGDGLFRVGDNQEDRIRRFTVELRRDRSAYLEMRTERETHRLSGTWSPRSSNTVTLSINRGFNNRFTSGYGNVTFGSRNRFEGVELNGVTDNRRYSIDFRASGSGGGSGGSGGWGGSGGSGGNTSRPADGSFEGGIRAVNSTVNGRGSVTVDLKRSNLRRIDVDLRPGGSADIRVTGDRNFRMRGTWDHQRGSQGIRILLESGFEDNQRIDGQGFIVLDRNRRVSKLDLSGKVGGKNFKILFLPS